MSRPGRFLARLEAREQTADVTSAKAGVHVRAEATLRQASAAFDRQKTLLANGFTTQSSHDNAQQALQAARATLDAARSNLATAQEQLVYTSLQADASGVVVARNAEAGQVVEAAQAVFSIARDGERDAIFDVNERLLARPRGDDTIELALVSNPSVRAEGRVREVAPAIDPSTGTVRVKVAIQSPPPAMTLGAAVTGVGRFQPEDVFILPAGAFFTDNGQPAVWTVDPASHVAAIRPIVVDSYRTGELLVRSGLKAGDVVDRRGLPPVQLAQARPGRQTFAGRRQGCQGGHEMRRACSSLRLLSSPWDSPPASPSRRPKARRRQPFALSCPSWSSRAASRSSASRARSSHASRPIADFVSWGA